MSAEDEALALFRRLLAEKGAEALLAHLSKLDRMDGDVEARLAIGDGGVTLLHALAPAHVRPLMNARGEIEFSWQRTLACRLLGQEAYFWGLTVLGGSRGLTFFVLLLNAVIAISFLGLFQMVPPLAMLVLNVVAMFYIVGVVFPIAYDFGIAAVLMRRFSFVMYIAVSAANLVCLAALLNWVRVFPNEVAALTRVGHARERGCASFHCAHSCYGSPPSPTDKF